MNRIVPAPSYDTAQQLTDQKFCSDIGFQDGELVTERKLIWFLQENVISREIRPSRYSKVRTTKDGETVKQTLGKSSILNYVAAIVDLWSFQSSSGVSTHPNPRGEALQAVLKTHARREHVRKRLEFSDRAAGTLQDSYNEGNMADIVRFCWTGWQAQPNQKKQSVESYLRTAADFLFSHNMLLRGESRRTVELPDLFTIELLNEGPTPCWPMVMIMDNGKTNQVGRLEYAAVARHRNPLLCTMSHLAFYFFYRWDIVREEHPKFQQRQQWYNSHVFKGERSDRPLFVRHPAGVD